jgi:uncharacterized membrane protein
MKNLVQFILYIHIFSGAIALITGLLAILSAKGKAAHNRNGRIYFYAMTLVFITGLIVAGYKTNRFLTLIAFLSYYSVFAGVRALKLKNLHKAQNPKWFDWAACGINAIANIAFIGLGLFYLIEKGSTAGSLLSIGFGIGGLLISYTNLIPFLFRPKKAYHWYLSHIGNMMGGYIATFTAFLSTMVTRFDLMNPFIAFAIPSLVGIPLLLYYQSRIEQNFQKTSKA